MSGLVPLPAVSGLVPLPAAFGPGMVWINPKAVNVVQVRPAAGSSPGTLVDLHIEGRQLMVSAHCVDAEAAANLARRVLEIIGGTATEKRPHNDRHPHHRHHRRT